MTLEADTLLQLQKWWDTICYAFYQSMSKNKSWPQYNKLKAKNYDITKFILSPDTYSKYITAEENFEEFSGALRVHLVKDTTILSSKNQNNMSNFLLTCTTKMDLNFFSQLSSQ